MPAQSDKVIADPEYEAQVPHVAKESSGTKQESVFIDDDRRNIHESDDVLLVIDDDDNFAKILRDLAQSKGYKCIVAGDGRTGIYLAKEYQPKGIILDITLPDIDGYKVLEQLKFSLKTRHIPVEIISGHSDAKQKTLQQGAIGFLSKPVEEQQLVEALSQITQLVSKNIRDILIIDDDSANQKATSQLLKSKDIRIKGVGTGAAGYKEIKENKYDCIILDLGLPDMSGFEVLEKLNQSGIQSLPPIIIYTGREIGEKEQKQLDNYSSSIVIKGVGSAERLLDDVSLFLHHINDNEAVNILHDEDELIKGRKVLLVDDDMRNSYALSKSLFEVGVDVEMATNGQEAIEILEKDSAFELVLMDTMMPVMDGNEATKAIRKMSHYKNIPIIALTAKTMPEDREKCLKSGASEYITKPVDFDDLMSIMRIWLFQHKQ
jgi:CheY-like chemotaxis protein